MIQHLSLYTRLISVQIRSQMQYRASFFMEIGGTALTTLGEFASLALVFGRFESLGGWSIGQVGLLYGMAELAFGLMDLVFSGFDPDTFGLMVRRGGFDQLLLRPVKIELQILGSQFLLRRFGRIFMGLAILVYALQLTEISWTSLKMLLLGLAVFSQICFFGGLFMTGATITFWTIESIEVINIFTYGGSYMISHPMHIFPDLMRRFFTYILPAIFLNYYPALYILDLPDPFGFPTWAPFLAPVAGLSVLLAAFAFWRYGLRHYQSTGT